MTEPPRALLADLSVALRRLLGVADVSEGLDDLEYSLSALLPDAHVTAPLESIVEAAAAAANKQPSVIPGLLSAEATTRLRPLHTAIVEARSMAYGGDATVVEMVGQLATLADLLAVNDIAEFDSALMELETAPLARNRLELLKGMAP